MAGDFSGPVDLLGDPWVEPKDARGRKRHKRCTQIAEKVGVLKACGHPTEVIALRLGLSEPTLRKYYFRELQHGVALAQAVLNEAMWDKAVKDKNASAARFMDDQFKKGNVERVARPETSDREPLKGKKELRQDAAEAVGGIYATPEAPKFVQ